MNKRDRSQHNLRAKSSSQHAMGFSMIELMIAIVVLTILIVTAVASYRNQGMRANRTNAIDELLRQAAFQQRQFSNNNQYTAVGNFLTDNGGYQIQTAVPAGGATYVLSAVPQGNQANDSCGTLSINNVGQKTSSVGDNRQCWAGRNG